MPSLTARIPDLQYVGPVVGVQIGPSSALRKALQERNGSIPQPVEAKMLIDTGASLSAIKEGIASHLGLKAHGITKIATPSDGSYQCSLYDVDILFPVHHLVVPNVRVIESAFEKQNIDGLIGRDILKIGLLVYTGYDNSFTIAF